MCKILFKPSSRMKVEVLKEQEKQISSKEKIMLACTYENVMAFDIFLQDVIIGFMMVRKYEEGGYFLWNYAIDFKYQKQGLGSVALMEFISFMKQNHRMTKMTTTYTWGNEHAKHIYEKIGFVETDIVYENGIHEVNMMYGKEK